MKPSDSHPEPRRKISAMFRFWRKVMAADGSKLPPAPRTAVVSEFDEPVSSRFQRISKSLMLPIQPNPAFAHDAVTEGRFASARAVANCPSNCAAAGSSPADDGHPAHAGSIRVAFRSQTRIWERTWERDSIAHGGGAPTADPRHTLQLIRAERESQPEVARRGATAVASNQSKSNLIQVHPTTEHANGQPKVPGRETAAAAGTSALFGLSGLIRVNPAIEIPCSRFLPTFMSQSDLSPQAAGLHDAHSRTPGASHPYRLTRRRMPAAKLSQG